jgi:uncharacterized flavoprotein (TIGR03862 family)
MGRKFLMAGRGGLNLTHSEDLSLFIKKYTDRAGILAPIIYEFSPQNLREWCEGLGEKTFIGSSGRIFPESFKASPLLKAWIKRLKNQGVNFLYRYDWQGWDQNNLLFDTPEGSVTIETDAVLLALGGASWPRLGSDGSWVPLLKEKGIDIAPLEPANCGFLCEWSEMFCNRFAGQPVKPVIARVKDLELQGEIMITAKGVEGGAVYALSSRLRQQINESGTARLHLDLKPDLTLEIIKDRLLKPRGSKSLSSYLAKTLNLSPVAIGLLMENPERKNLNHYSPEQLGRLIKNHTITLHSPYPIDRAISTAGGVKFSDLDDNLMLTDQPGIFIAGEMLDWEAPTGGYLLQASFATGVRAAQGIALWLTK